MRCFSKAPRHKRMNVMQFFGRLFISISVLTFSIFEVGSIQVFVFSGFFPFGILFNSGFCLFWILSIRDFVRSGFCPIRDFVH